MARRCFMALKLLQNSSSIFRELTNCGTHFRPVQGQSFRSVRWYSKGGGSSGGGGAGGGGCNSGKPPLGDGGFFQNFVKNLRKVVKGDEMQESLKGFHEEREKMQQSYVMQQTRLKFKGLVEMMGSVGTRGTEKMSKGWNFLKNTSTKVYQEGSKTEMAQKSHAAGTKFVESVQKTAEEIGKTDAGEVVKKGAEVVKEDLIDDIVQQSNPYKRPDMVMKRSDLVTDFSSKQSLTRTIKPDEETKDVVVTKQSAWKEQWTRWREDNPVSNLYHSTKIKYDESDNILIRAARMITDKVGDIVSGSITQTDMAETLAEIRKVDPTFCSQDFLKQCQYDIIPPVLEAYMQGMEDVLRDWCHEPAFNVLSAVMRQRHEPGVALESKVLEVRDIDIVMAKVLEQGPILMLTFQAQQLTLKKNGDSLDEVLENVVYLWALCRDQSIYDPRTAWRVLEFGIQSSSKMLA